MVFFGKWQGPWHWHGLVQCGALKKWAAGLSVFPNPVLGALSQVLVSPNVPILKLNGA